MEGVSAAYVRVFLLKFVCPREGCEGTMAPLPPGWGPQPEGSAECSACGARRTEADFLAEVERDMEAQRAAA